jgi:hypothetical protein
MFFGYKILKKHTLISMYSKVKKQQLLKIPVYANIQTDQFHSPPPLIQSEAGSLREFPGPGVVAEFIVRIDDDQPPADQRVAAQRDQLLLQGWHWSGRFIAGGSSQ